MSCGRGGNGVSGLWLSRSIAPICPGESPVCDRWQRGILRSWPISWGAGGSFTARKAVKRDGQLMLTGALRNDIPVIPGSAGGAGGTPHVAWLREIIDEIVHEQGLHFRIGCEPPLVYACKPSGGSGTRC